MAAAAGRAGGEAPGLYRPDEVFWQVNREAVLLLTGPRALLLQVAHPLVAAGVAAHSRFREEPLARLRRTLDAMLAMIFGGRAEAEAAAAAVNAAHARVRGTLGEATRVFPAGTPYSAGDPDLARWVHATLVDSALAGFEAFVRPLGAAERDRFVVESNRVGGLLGIPRSHTFAGFAAFRAYLDDMLAGPELEVGAEGAAVAEAVLHPPLRLVPRAAGDLASLAGVALLPAAARERYGLPFGPGRARAWRALRAGVRAVRPRLPARLRLLPRAYRAERERGLRR